MLATDESSAFWRRSRLGEGNGGNGEGGNSGGRSGGGDRNRRGGSGDGGGRSCGRDDAGRGSVGDSCGGEVERITVEGEVFVMVVVVMLELSPRCILVAVGA